MIRNHFKRLLAEREFAEARVVTVKEIASATGIHRNTLTRFANEHGYNVGLDVIDRLCTYFKCSVAELLQHIDEPSVELNQPMNEKGASK